MPTDLERFIQYAQTFELAQAADAWATLEPLFAEDAVHLVHHGGSLGGDDYGREAVIAGLRDSVLLHDRRFDVRIPEIVEGPSTRPDGVWMRYVLTLRRQGIPDLSFTGEHVTEYQGGRIRRVEEWLAEDTPERVARFLADYGDALGEPASPPRVPGPLDRQVLDTAMARSLVRIYGGAKSEQDIGAALSVCSDAFVLDTPAFGTRSNGRAEAAEQLEIFFSAFPDHAVALEGLASGDAVAAWGRATLSLRGDLIGIAPTGRTAELAFVSLFEVADGAIRAERFYFDRAEFCEQLGLSYRAIDEALSTLRGGGRAVAAGS